MAKRCVPLLLDQRTFPELLKKRLPKRKELFLWGDKSVIGERCVAIVGSRAAYPAQILTARRWARQFVDAGLVVVSGGAIGVDGAAHEGALEGNGKTIAILGGGFDHLYPPRHGELFARIRERGALVTPFSPAQGPRRSLFAIRNGVIAAISEVVIVVAAQLRSGALNTARWCLKLNVPLAVVPGTKGANRLLTDPAFSRICVPVHEIGGVFAMLSGKKNSAVLEKDLSHEDRLILGALSGAKKWAFTELQKQTGLDAGDLAMKLMGLEQSGKLRLEPDGRYSSYIS